MRLILVLAATAVVLTVVLTGCGHKPPQASPPGISTTVDATVQSKGSGHCKDGKCR